MARIRSIHPGQWSDEDFVCLSFPARLLALALRNLADDHGIFEWKPRTIKMQLFPADNIDMEPLLSELVTLIRGLPALKLHHRHRRQTKLEC